MRGVVFLIVLATLSTTCVFAQPSEEGQPEGSVRAGVAEEPEPEVPQWAQNLRRAEIVATGSYPLTLLAARLVYSLARFTVKSIQARAIDMNYAPWFLAPPGAPELVFAEKVGIVTGAAGLSSLIAFIDYRRGVLEDESAE